VSTELERTVVAIALDDLADDERVKRHHDPVDDRYDFAAILADPTWSTGERAVIRVAQALWHGYYATDASLGELFAVDADSFDRLMRAIGVRYHGVGCVVDVWRAG
jgi:hypothetical protein